MKIFIQNIKQGLTETEENVSSDFLPEKLQAFYPNLFSVKALIDRFDRDLRIKLSFKSKAYFKCDRCLEFFDKPVSGEYDQIYTLGSNTRTDDLEIMKLPMDSKEIDVSPLLTEVVLLNHPIKMLCRSDCQGLCPGCGVDLNNQECKCSEPTGDPRWDELRKLIN